MLSRRRELTIGFQLLKERHLPSWRKIVMNQDERKASLDDSISAVDDKVQAA